MKSIRLSLISNVVLENLLRDLKIWFPNGNPWTKENSQWVMLTEELISQCKETEENANAWWKVKTRLQPINFQILLHLYFSKEAIFIGKTKQVSLVD